MVDDAPPSTYVTYNECRLNTKHLHDKISDVDESIEKIIRILQGNGEGGIIWKVNLMMQRNQWMDKCMAVAISVMSTLITLYLAGVLHL